MNELSPCPLCLGERTTRYYRDNRRGYLRCERCELVFVPPGDHLTREREKAEYDLHRNEIHDPGYRQFLARLAEPLSERLAPGASGLDFGCGPGPALAAMLREQGFTVALYDVFYQPDAAVLNEQYDFVCATEVVEHLHRPGEVLKQLWQLLRPGGHLGVMTKLVKGQEAFAGWHYKNDPTHVCFFSDQTWQWWAAEFGAGLERIGADVMILKRN